MTLACCTDEPRVLYNLHLYIGGSRCVNCVLAGVIIAGYNLFLATIHAGTRNPELTYDGRVPYSTHHMSAQRDFPGVFACFQVTKP